MEKIGRVLCAAALVAFGGAQINVARRSEPVIVQAESSQNGPRCGVHCGTERWAVKTLSDADASQVNPSPVLKTVDWLVSQEPPDERPENNRVAPIELTTFAVEARLLGFKRESDRDFHIVIGDKVVRKTMIVEIPNPQCNGVCSSTAVGAMLRAGQNFVRHCGVPTARFKKLTKPFLIRMVGVGFFDFPHGQTGVAKNAIELHPILNVDFPDESDDCARHLTIQ